MTYLQSNIKFLSKLHEYSLSIFGWLDVNNLNLDESLSWSNLI